MNSQEALNSLCKNCEKYINSIPVETKPNETYDIHHCGYQMCPFITIDNSHCEEYDTLQELIDNNERNEESIKLKNSYISMLENALDKSCVTIMRILNCLKTNDCKFCPLDRCVQNDIEDNWENSNDIKKYLLQESEKQ